MGALLATGALYTFRHLRGGARRLGPRGHRHFGWIDEVGPHVTDVSGGMLGYARLSAAVAPGQLLGRPPRRRSGSKIPCATLRLTKQTFNERLRTMQPRNGSARLGHHHTIVQGGFTMGKAARYGMATALIGVLSIGASSAANWPPSIVGTCNGFANQAAVRLH